MVSFRVPVAVLLMMASFQVAADACFADPADRFQAVERDLHEFYRTVSFALDQAPTEQFNVAARQALIGDDPYDLFAWVRDQTRLLPYQGALKGPRGTLMELGGSHLDRALLLAKLLETAGHQVRLAHATLDQDAVAQLETLPHSDSAPARPVSSADKEDIYRELARQMGTDANTLGDRARAQEQQALAMREQFSGEIKRQSQALAAQIDWSGPDPAETGQRQAALADHWWVQLRTRHGWTDLDPSLPTLQPDNRLHQGHFDTLWAEDLPTEAMHVLAFEVVAERLERGRLRERTALSHEVPAMDLPGQPLVLEMHPSGLPEETTLMGQIDGNDYDNIHDRMNRLLLEEDEWVPFLAIGGKPVVQKAIRIDGSVVDQLGRLAQAELMEQASGLLGQLGRGHGEEARPTPELTAVFLRLTVNAPGRQAETFERSLMDVVGPHRRAERPRDFEFSDAVREARALGMFSSTEIMAQSSWWPAAYAVGHILHDILANRRAMLGAVHALRRDSLELTGKAIEALNPAPADLVSLVSLRHTLSPYGDRIALTRLNLLTTFERLDGSADGPVLTLGFDIIDNRVEVIGDSGADARHVRLTQGVIDTALEARLLDTEGRVINASLAFGQALDTTPWQPLNVVQLEAVSPNTAAYLNQALAAGNQIVLPADPHRVEDLTWWRIDPATGTTLGIGAHGRGQSLVETLITQWKAINNARSAVSFILTVWKCLVPGRPAEAMQCCIMREGAKVLVKKGLGALYKEYLELLGWFPESLVYQLALGEVIGHFSGAGVNDLAPDPC